ncbi:unnamed protein product [Ectocarpus sp. CCAP 1310/34]|nr:unnamed protein product [Ectocarpus sp. CCAP 1310/34]
MSFSISIKLGVQIRPRTRPLTRRLRLLTPPIRDLPAFRLSPSNVVSCWRLALAVLGDAHCRCGAVRCRQTCCRNCSGAACHIPEPDLKALTETVNKLSTSVHEAQQQGSRIEDEDIAELLAELRIEPGKRIEEEAVNAIQGWAAIEDDEVVEAIRLDTVDDMTAQLKWGARVGRPRGGGRTGGGQRR